MASTYGSREVRHDVDYSLKLPLMTREQIRKIGEENAQQVANLIIRSHQSQQPITEYKPDTSAMQQKKSADLPFMTREQLRKIDEDNVQQVANLILWSCRAQQETLEKEKRS